MNNQPDRNTSPRYPPAPKGIDKTYVEGENQQQVFPELRPGTRVNTASFQSANPYTQTGSPPTRTGGGMPMGADALPSGSEPLPLGSGTVVGLLGTGGMAKVYKIWNEKLEVFRAVKILLPTQQADLKSRFETEAKITAKLHHPNIVEIYSVGEWNGLPYLEMEFLDGISLEAMITNIGKLPDVACGAIAILVARALDYAHSQEFLIYGKTYQGVIHRDLKPANIMIPKIGDVRLMDFGIARPTETSLHTVEGNIVGTMQYLSPEQMDGVDIDARTDIYSFGAILYEMLTGTKTFPQDTITNLMKKKIMNEYRKFSDFDFAVSHQLARISQKCLQINRNDRYRDMSALLVELESAYRTLSSESPVKMLKRYLNNPESFAGSSKGAFRLHFSPKVVIPIAGVLGIGALVAVFIITGPKGESEEATNKVPAVAAPAKPGPPVEKPAARPSGTEGGLKPLGPSDRQPPPAGPAIAERTPLPTPRPRPRISETKPTPPPVTKTEPALSPFDALKKKYGSDDALAIGKKAMAAGDFDGAVLALTNVPTGHPETTVKTLLLFEACLSSGKIGDALVIANGKSINDAQFDYLCGKLYERTGKDKQALEFYQTALTKPSIIRSRTDIRNDALYQTAILWTAQHRINPSPDSRIQALNAWNTVKRTYMATPNHPRFKRANTELASIQ
ncbi:MAG: serine/threonine protein kinase [Chitinispirillaceae bacterium]|nr:serine/threonine protein kinase [Chitinispirillaceae bacterium]